MRQIYRPWSRLERAVTGARSGARMWLASGFTLALITAAVGVTLWSYEGAASARDEAGNVDRENATVILAETYLFQEREAVDEYLLVPAPDLLVEVREFASQFKRLLLTVEHDQLGQRRLTRRAIAGNERFLSIFFSRAKDALSRPNERTRLVETLVRHEAAALHPLAVLRPLNDREAQRSEDRANALSARALIAGVIAGVLAILGCLAFALYASALVRRITRQREALAKVDRVKDDFIASVSHELRTPLTSIRGYLELILDDEVGEVSEEQREFLNIIDRNSSRLMSLVEDLLFSAQIEAGRLDLELGDVELGVLVDNSVESARPRAAENGVELTGSTTDGLALRGDAKRLSQLLDNLVSNGIKFTPSGGTVAVSLARSNGHAVIEVSDTGTGISPEDQAHLFERFYRTSSAASIPGTGLGLSITKVIAEAHGGVIEVASALGSGTTFRVELPLGRVETQEDAE
jgi:signal transduction histidine kinase